MSDYWESRYASGGTSGRGSQGVFAQTKAGLVNDALDRWNIQTVLDIGCGDGVVARLIDAKEYLGLDPSPTALALAQRRNPTKSFDHLGVPEPREAHLSLDILHHLVDDDDYDQHMDLLFAAQRLAVIWVHDYTGAGAAGHSRHRKWFNQVPKAWEIEQMVPIFDVPVTFYVYMRVE